MKKRPVPPSVSNFALGGVAALFVVTLGILAALFYDLRARKSAASASPLEANAAVKAAAAREVLAERAISDYSRKTIADTGQGAPAQQDAPVIRVALRTDGASSSAPAEHLAEPIVPAPVEASAGGKDTVAADETRRPLTVPAAPVVVKDNGNNEMVPDIKGLSYTAKKALSNSLDANTPKAGENKPGKKPEAKKLNPSAPPKNPVKPEPGRAAQASTEPSKPAPLPPLDPLKIDVSKAPIYVLIDGRRIRALAVRDMGATLSVKNEAGTDITFKKSDIKEILRG